MTEESVARAIAEEQAKIARKNGPSETDGNVPLTVAGTSERKHSASESEMERIRELEKEVMDLKITNRRKDYFLEQLQMGREGLARERGEYVEKLIILNRHVGELETRLLQLAAPETAKDRHDQPTI